MADAPDKRTCAAVLPDLSGDQHQMHPKGVQRGRHGAGGAVLGVGLCDIVHGHPVPHVSTTDQNVPSAPEPVCSPGCPAGGAPRNRCAAGKSTNTLTSGTRYRLDGHRARNIPTRLVCSANTLTKGPSATCRRTAKSGTQTTPTPCSAKWTKASIVVAVLAIGKSTSKPVANLSNGQGWILPVAGYL